MPPRKSLCGYDKILSLRPVFGLEININIFTWYGAGHTFRSSHCPSSNPSLVFTSWAVVRVVCGVFGGAMLHQILSG